ncbi:hypothetical protein I4U23_018176 [Adineta vaga]|nr:hypothetical protein I4U23_018176 [Adineta vaga]
MQGLKRLFGIVFMALILIFAIIHLGVSISIIVKVRNYADIFKPERGLAIFNVVLSIYGIVIGIFGLLALLTNRLILGKITAFASIALAFFALVSLITALIINSLAINYASSHFESRLVDYQNSQNSRNIVDKIQTSYDCCGSDTWLDWMTVGLNATAPSTNNTVTTIATGLNTTTAATQFNITTTTDGGIIFTTTTATTSTTTEIVIVSNTTTVFTVSSTTNADTTSSTITADTTVLAGKMFNNDVQTGVRRKRQAQTDTDAIVGLLTSISVTLPQSCCTNDLSSTDNLANLYCISNANNVTNTIHPNGCSKKLGKFAVGQTLGLAVINSFLVVLSIAVIPLLLEKDSSQNYTQSMPNNPQIAQYQQYSNEPYQYNPVQYQTDMSYSNFLPSTTANT